MRPKHGARRGINDAQPSRAAPVVVDIREAATARSDTGHGFVAQLPSDQLAARAIALRRRGGRNGAAPHIGQAVGHASVAQRAPNTKWNELTAGRLDEVRNHRIAGRPRQVIPEPAAVGVGREPVRPAGEVQRIPRRARTTRRSIGRDDLAVECAVGATAGREARFVVGRQPFDHPARLILIGEESGQATEYRLQRPPQSPGSVEMEHMRQLVHDHESFPAVVVLQPGVGDRRGEKNREAIRREDGREAVRRIDVVRERHVDNAPRWVQLTRQQPVRALGFARRFHGAPAIDGPKMDAKVLRVECTPGAGGILPQCWARDQQQDGARRTTHVHFAISRKQSSMPRTTPRAYRSRPSGDNSISRELGTGAVGEDARRAAVEAAQPVAATRSAIRARRMWRKLAFSNRLGHLTLWPWALANIAAGRTMPARNSALIAASR